MEKEINNSNNNKENKDQDEKHDINNPGYGYWKRESDLADRDKFIPKQIELKNELTLDNKKSLGSVWNTAGTWEEKHYKKSQIEDFFNQNIKNKKVDNSLQLLSVKNYSGDVSVLL